MTEKEKEFVLSLENKIKKFKIKTTVKEALKKTQNRFARVTYNDGQKELIETGIEWFLCSKSPAYFINKYCYISIPNIGIIPFNTYYFQTELLNEIEDFQRLVFLKSRQTGISTVIAFYSLWRCLFKNSENIAVISKNLKAAQEFMDKVKITLEALPSFLNLKLEVENKSSLVFINKSSIKSEARSVNAGRSATLSLLILDEAAHYGSDGMIRQIVGSAGPALTKTGGSTIIISTPNGSSGSGAYYYEQVQRLKTSNYNPKIEKLIEIDWFEVPDEKKVGLRKGYNDVLNKYIERDYYNNPAVRKEMREFFGKVEEDWKNNEWLRSQYDLLQSVLFSQEILHNFVIMGNSVFTTETLDEVRKKVREPIQVDRLDKYSIRGFWIWEHPKPKNKYVIGVDVSKGSGSDSSTIQVVDADTYSQVAEFGGFISTLEFSRVIKRIAKYYNNAYVVIECNGIGEAVFNGVYMDENDPYSNVYKQVVSRNNIKITTGWMTDMKTRQLMTNNIIDWITIDELFVDLGIRSSRLLSQLSTWIWSGNGRPDHTDNTHDDLIIALALALYNRDKAINSGQSFVIGEDGRTIEYSSDDELTAVDDFENSGFDFITGDKKSMKEQLMEKTNCSYEQYVWLLNGE